MKHGFTLLELLIVIVIVAILATLGMTQYAAVIERSRGAEARQILGQLRSICAGYYMQDGNTSNCNDAGLNIATTTTNDTVPGNCRTSHYFSYNATNPGGGSTSATFLATRCTASGKNPQGSSGRSLTLTTNYGAGGTDAWTNTFGY